MSTLSLIDLPPEVRSLIYDFLLCDASSDNDRIIYYGRKSPSTNQAFFALSQIKGDFGLHQMTKPQASLVNLSDLLNLAATCRHLRSELLAFAWSNADIHIIPTSKEPETLIRFAECIFDDHRSKTCRNFIRTLQINILEATWKPHHTRAIAEIIHRRLPRLEKLTVQVGYQGPALGSGPLQKALCALAVLELHIAVELQFKPYGFRIYRISHAASQNQTNQQARASADAARLAAIRSKGQKRRMIKTEREQKDEILDILQDTVDLRRLALG